jgi:hypothetical protein
MYVYNPARLRGRTRRTLLAAAVVAGALATGALPAGASAATLAVSTDTLSYQDTSGERNSLSVREVAGALIISDTTALSNLPLQQRRCVSVDSRTMRCPLVKRVVARMGNGDDTAGPINTHLPVEIRGEGGNDTYEAGSPSFLTNVEFAGGRGVKDTVSYAGSGGSASGGVRITNDGVPNDGRIGLDTDNVGPDVEVLIGSGKRDEITANGALPFAVTGEFARTFVRGGHGDDVLRVGATGTQVTILNGPVADGADRIIGGPVSSTVDYGERTRPVNATLNFGGADDGETGERDEILGGHETLAGGQGGDTLRAPNVSTASHAISGNGGNDQIDGAEGNDTLSGGAGRDSIRGLGRDDRILARDGESDTVDCGLGTDTVEIDPIEHFASCENGTIGVLRLAPKTLRTEAGETAKVRLNWRHPRGWRQLRSVTLRIYRGDARVGAVAINPRTRRIEARGAVTLRGRTGRLVRHKKTVSAQLALRLDRKLAGRRLRLDVEAVDIRGQRQLERRAGSIRVAR